LAGVSGKLTYDPQAWQTAMIIVSSTCLVLFVLTFKMTHERIKPAIKQSSIKEDFKSLLHNGPWWILLGGVLFFNFFGAVRYAVIPYYFTTQIAEGATLSFFSIEFLFYAGIFFTIGEIANMVGVAIATPITFRIGKKSTFLYSLFAIMALCIAFYYVPTDSAAGYWTLLILQIATGIFTGIISPLVWSMYADISDYAELKFKTASTGLIFSSSSMAQKFGGAFGTSAVLWLLAAFGFNTAEGAVQTADAVEGLRLLISWIPAGIAALSAIFIFIYPLTTNRMKEITKQLNNSREI
jgi:GPH family glycoside/pentoside/hexuronide:cation symporter